MPKYRNKEVIEAVKWTGDNIQEIFDFLTGTTGQRVEMEGENFFVDVRSRTGRENNLILKTPQGMRVSFIGDFIVKTNDGNFYPCQPRIFNKSYEMVRVYESD